MQQAKTGRKSRERFLEQTNIDQLLGIFDLVTDTLLWIKDSESRIIHCNKFFLEHVGGKTLSNVLGSDDFAFSPPHIARQFIRDDKRVIEGNRVVERLELNSLHSGEIAWFITSKCPLYDSKGKAIGSFGTSRPLDPNVQVTSAFDALKVPTGYIRKNFSEDICLRQLASISNLSVSALGRRFKKHMGKTPKQFINEIRLENARRMLVETSLPIMIIANKSGFVDHSYFSRQFKLLFGEIPSVFRKNHCPTVTANERHRL